MGRTGLIRPPLPFCPFSLLYNDSPFACIAVLFPFWLQAILFRVMHIYYSAFCFLEFGA